MWSAAMDVGGWLRSLGLGQYEANFRDNKIDVDVLADLTDGDLEKLGLPLGDRKRLLKAIARLAATAPSAPSSSVSEMEEEERPKGGRAGTSRPSGRPAPRDTAERRPITVMFCDLVGSTGIAAKLDAEDWRNFVSAYLDAASEAVAQMGGRVAKTLGDGLMALFGHPIAQENDSERAVRAALAIQRALAELNHKNAGSGAPELVARIGVESGAVVVEPTGEVFGEAPNVAARSRPSRPGNGARDLERAAPDRRAVRHRGSRRACAQRSADAGRALPDRTGERRPALGCPRPHPTSRARGGA
jgi:class 3 adenylate cyclase